MKPFFISNYHVGTRWRLKLVTKLLNFDKSKVVLDAGCGEGLLSYVLSKKSEKVVGLDISKSVIEENNKISNNRLSFTSLDLNNLSKKFKAESFDSIICMDVLEHSYGFKNIIRNVYFVLKKRGAFLATIPTFDNHGHFEYDNIELLKDIFKKQGFNIVLLRRIQMPFFAKNIHTFINFIRKLTGYEMKEVDSFDETLSSELRKNQPLLFKVYKLFFSIIFLLTKLDFQTYTKGKDFILIKLIKK